MLLADSETCIPWGGWFQVSTVVTTIWFQAQSDKPNIHHELTSKLSTSSLDWPQSPLRNTHQSLKFWQPPGRNFHHSKNTFQKVYSSSPLNARTSSYIQSTMVSWWSLITICMMQEFNFLLSHAWLSETDLNRDHLQYFLDKLQNSSFDNSINDEAVLPAQMSNLHEFPFSAMPVLFYFAQLHSYVIRNHNNSA